jgi:hypothetical protein
MQLLKLLKLPYAIWNFHKFQDFQYLPKLYNFEVFISPLILLGGRPPYWLSKSTPEPTHGCTPKYLSFKRYMAKNLNKWKCFFKQVGYQFSATASLA